MTSYISRAMLESVKDVNLFNRELTLRFMKTVPYSNDFVPMQLAEGGEAAMKVRFTDGTAGIDNLHNEATVVSRYDTLGRRILLAQCLAVVVHRTPIIKAGDLRLRPGQCSADRQRTGAAADLQQASVTVKVKAAQKFLQDGNRVKVSVRFRGREMAHTNLGEKLLMDFADACAEVASMEKNPKLEGRFMAMFLAPKNSK